MRRLALPDEILMKVEKPARYIGGEYNSVMKDKDKVDVRFCMCFPDVYEIGMSHLGIQILYDMFNRREDTWCERVYSPWPDLDAEMREHDITLAKNGIAVCRIAFADRIVVDEFKKHKTLGELILIDRVTDMTSACGVVEEVHTEETGLYEGRIDRNVRAAIKGQKAVIVPFAAGNVTRDFVESVEKKLSIDGRHTYLYAPDIREDVNAVLKHLHHAGIIVLLFASEQQIAGIKVEGAEVYSGDWNADGELDSDEIADEIRKESVYDAAQVHDGNYI